MRSEPTLELVEWFDHTLTEGAYGIAEARKKKLQKRQSVGWVIGQTADSITLAHTRDGKKDFADILVLGTSMVLRRKRLTHV